VAVAASERKSFGKTDGRLQLLSAQMFFQLLSTQTLFLSTQILLQIFGKAVARVQLLELLELLWRQRLSSHMFPSHMFPRHV
jgi:hypothetical protein